MVREKRVLIRGCLFAILAAGFWMSSIVFADGEYLLVNGFNSLNLLRFDAHTGAFIDEFIAFPRDILNRPEDIIQAPDGNLLISFPDNGFIKKYNIETGAYMGDFATLGYCRGMVLGADGNVYVSTYGKIQRYNGMTGEYLGQFSNTGMAESHSLLFYNHYLYCADIGHDKIYRIDAQTGSAEILVSGGELSHPEGLLIGKDGYLYAASGYTNRILRYDANTGEYIDSFLKYPPQTPSVLNEPQDILYGLDGNLLVSSFGSHSIYRYNGTSGEYIGLFCSSSKLGSPTNMLLIPEPGTLGLMGLGVMFLRRRK